MDGLGGLCNPVLIPGMPAGAGAAGFGFSLGSAHATILHLMGLDHEKLAYRYSGRYFRLTDVSGTVIKPVLA